MQPTFNNRKMPFFKLFITAIFSVVIITSSFGTQAADNISASSTGRTVPASEKSDDKSAAEEKPDPTADDEKALESGNMEDKQVAVLQSLDKITARTQKFEASVGETVKFGSIYIMVRACKKAPPFEKPEAAAFLQIWQKQISDADEPILQQAPASEWIFSGWMFASSPALSAMDHPVYDVWVTDCIDKTSSDSATTEPGNSKKTGEKPASKKAP